MTSLQRLQCAGVAPEPGWPVSGADDLVLGFTDAGQRVQPIRDQVRDIGDSIASDIAVRFQAGDSRLLKCRKTEKSAIEFLLVRYVDKRLMKCNDLYLRTESILAIIRGLT